MRRYLGIALTTVIAFIVAAGIILWAMYSYFSSAQKQQLKIETEMAALAVASQQENYLAKLPHGNYRTTWILPDGSVIFDSDGTLSAMENHLEREEIKLALSTGYGESQRYSDTMLTRMLYSARRLPDGSVLRLSMPQDTVFKMIVDVGVPISVILLLTLVIIAVIAAKETKRANQEETEAMRREFTANVSHELKTPLHAISGYAELLKNGMVRQEDTGAFAEKIYRETQRMIRLVQDIIVLSRLDEGKESTAKSKLNLYQLAEGVLGSLEPLARQQEISLELIGQQVTLEGMPQLLHSMLYNICENAIKYNRPQGSVLVEVSKVEGRPQFSVRDTGIGISHADRSRIFERFFRVDKSHSKEVGGTGLGLSIVKHAAKLHNAKVEVESIVDEGTLITVKF